MPVLVAEVNPTRICEDCGGVFDDADGRWYKYEESTWLCDDCHDERMDDDEDYSE